MCDKGEEGGMGELCSPMDDFLWSLILNQLDPVSKQVMRRTCRKWCSLIGQVLVMDIETKTMVSLPKLFPRRDLETVMSQSGAPLHEARETMIKHGGDMVTSILELIPDTPPTRPTDLSPYSRVRIHDGSYFHLRVSRRIFI
jgi:hypothetical protein